MCEISDRTISEIARLIKSKEVSPVEVNQVMLDRIERLDGRLHSYLTVSAELAVRQAKRAEAEILAGKYRGPMHGIPFAAKDLIYTEHVRTTCASKILTDWVPDFDATVIRKLYDAGAVLLGKLSLTEFAGIGYHPSIPMPTNPWHENHWAGSSSSGSAVATAASLCFGSLGTDTGGSLRFPASACGVVGLKPTYGRVSRHGVFPLAESLDHVGPMTRSVADAAAILQVIAGFDIHDPVTLRDPVPDYPSMLDGGVGGLRVGFDRTFCEAGVESDVSAAVLEAAKALEDSGADLQDVKFSRIQEAVDAWGVIFTSECGLSHETTFSEHADDYSPAFRGFLEAAPGVRGIDYARANNVRQSIRRMVDDLLVKVDLLISPTMALAPMPLDGRLVEQVVDAEVGNALLRCTALFSLTGNPTISLPCGFTPSGLPIGLQLIGRHGEESTVLRAAHTYERASDWHARRPPL